MTFVDKRILEKHVFFGLKMVKYGNQKPGRNLFFFPYAVFTFELLLSVGDQ